MKKILPLLLLLPLAAWTQTNSSDWVTASVTGESTFRALTTRGYGDTTNLVLRVREHTALQGKMLTAARFHRPTATTNRVRIVIVPFGQTNEWTVFSQSPASAVSTVSGQLTPPVALFPGDQIKVPSETADTEQTRFVILEGN